MSVARNIADLIHTSGAVGIGTSSPTSKLQVDGGNGISLRSTSVPPKQWFCRKL